MEELEKITALTIIPLLIIILTAIFSPIHVPHTILNMIIYYLFLDIFIFTDEGI